MSAPTEQRLRELATKTAEAMTPAAFGPPEHLERIAMRRAYKVDADTKKLLAFLADAVGVLGVREALEVNAGQGCDYSRDALTALDSLTKETK